MKILVLGGCGRQGKVIAADLARMYRVDAADITGFADVKIDLSDYQTIRDMAPNYDVVVGALPSALGLHAMMATIDAGVSYVDLSFLDHDVSTFNSSAMDKNITVLHDCGIAPGLSHLIAGRAIHLGADDVSISVGGIAPQMIDDYVVTWSPEDLLEEYVRPARIIVDGEIKTVPALSGEITEHIPGIDNNGKIKGYYTDGLRSLLTKSGQVKRIVERTLRWPGHIEKIMPWVRQGTFLNSLRENYSESNFDMLAMKITASWGTGKVDTATLVVYGDTLMSAMAKTTALACSSFARLVASGTYKRTGVIPPEDIAMDSDAYRFVLDCMAEHGVVFSTKYPFEETE